VILDLTKLREAIRYEGRITRRVLLAYGAALAAIPTLGLRAEGPRKAAKLPDDVFKELGVGSGEPDEDSVVLWTRLAPKPKQEDGDGGMPHADFMVDWEIWPEEGKKMVIESGSVKAMPELGHSVHAVARKLTPGTWYRYQFRCGDQPSPIGHTRTMPKADPVPELLRFAFASCQNYEDGFYNAYLPMAGDNPDLVVFLGDYIYENDDPRKTVREHVGKRLDKGLVEYRARYGQYKSDPMLREMHRLCPWLVTWDDHEVEGNYANDLSKHHDRGKGPTREQFLVRRAHAYQAYYENIPVRPGRARPNKHNMDLYHSTAFGRLVNFAVLDTRQYRTDQPNGGEAAPINGAAKDPRNTLLGPEQKKWLLKILKESDAVWNVLAQQVMMGLVDHYGGKEPRYSMDAWPGYFHERAELIRFLAQNHIKNPVVISGDVHSNWVIELREDDRFPKKGEPPVAVEFVGTSISSKGNGEDVDEKRLKSLFADNPCLKFHNDHRGYVLCTVTPKEWRSEFRIVRQVEREAKPDAKAETAATFAVTAGKPGVNA
jgi:alkaline phosphatase D